MSNFEDCSCCRRHYYNLCAVMFLCLACLVYSGRMAATKKTQKPQQFCSFEDCAKY